MLQEGWEKNMLGKNHDGKNPLQELLPADCKRSKVLQVTDFSSVHFRDWCYLS